MSTPGRPAVVLFDVDGTLIDSGGAGGRSWGRAFAELHGVSADIVEFSEAGQTDPAIAVATFRAVVGREPAREDLGRLYASYLVHLDREVAESSGYRVHAGVVATLEALRQAGVTLGIVSGAMEGAARIKLARGGLNRFFVFGGYGSDTSSRAALTELALEKAAQLHGRLLDPADVSVVGDTPRDIDAARAVGAVAVTVATGGYDAQQLAAAGADHVLETLETPFPGL